MRTVTRALLGMLVLAGTLVACATSAPPAGDEPGPAARAETSAPLSGPVADRHPRVDPATGCAECHRRNDPQIVREWEQSLHGQQDVGCFVCHGAIGVDFQARPGDESCAACHSAVMGSLAHPPADRCFSCHDAHRLAYP